MDIVRREVEQKEASDWGEKREEMRNGSSQILKVFMKYL
jgi:hypothetical protein